MKRLASALLVLPLLAGCGGSGGSLGSDHDYQGSFSGAYSRALATTPGTVASSGIATYSTRGASFTLRLGDADALTGSVDDNGDATNAVLAHATASGTESIPVTDLRLDRNGSALTAGFSAALAADGGTASLYTVRLIRS